MRINIKDESCTGRELIRLSELLQISPTKVVLQLIDDNDYYAQLGDADNANKRILHRGTLPHEL